jgi:hypothetical protein
LVDPPHNDDQTTLLIGCWCNPFLVPTPIVAQRDEEVVDAVAPIIYHRDAIARAIDAAMPQHGLGPYRVLWPVEQDDERLR